MRCLFVHDFRSFGYGNEVYCTNLSYEIWKDRYLTVFDEMIILNRFKTIDYRPKDMVLSNGDNIHFTGDIDFFTQFSFIKNYKNYKQVIEHNINLVDFVIIRLDSFLGLIAAEICRKKQKKYLIEVAGCVFDSFWNKGFIGKCIAPILYIITRKEIYNAKYVIYVTEFFLEERYPTKGKFINCSNVNLEEIKAVSSPHEEGKKIILGTTASIDVKYKGQKDVIKALKYLKNKKKINKFKYQLVGSGNGNRLHRYVRKNNLEDYVEFLGPLNHIDVLKWLESIDIYIQPSKQEGLPRSLIEAMSKGRVCYGAATGGIPELLEKKFIFSNGRKRYKEIANLLLEYNELDTNKVITKNIKVSSKYNKNILNNRRKKFLKSILES